MSLKKNIVANYLGQGWTAVMQLAFIPLYIKYLGMEAYGLIGLFTVLQAGLVLLDMGMTPTLNREMARFTSGKHTPHSIRNLLFSLEIPCFIIAGLIAVTMWMVSGWLGQHWLRVEELSLDTVRVAITLMGVVAALRFVESIYRGAILGLQTHVWLNTVTALLSSVRSLGAVGILIWVSPTIEAFFAWQACISAVSLIVLALRVHRVLPVATQPICFSTQALADVWVFARGMIVTTFFSLLLTQVDKILLSRMLSLQTFGTYMLAVTVANGLMLFVAPVAQGYYPQFTELVAKKDKVGLISAYHQASQLMTVMVVPVALLLVFYGESVLYLWTGDTGLAGDSAPLLSLLALGTVFLGLMNIPYMLQLAYGWSMFAAKVNALIVFFQIPILLWATQHYGVIGAAWVWVGVTSIYILIVIPIMHRGLLPKEMWKWYLQDTILPSVAAISVICVGMLLRPMDLISSKLDQLSWLLIMFFLSFAAAVFTTQRFQKQFSTYIKKLYRH